MSPYRRARVAGRMGYAHRVAAEQKLGRPLRPGEVVDHKNGDKRDNAPENLQVFRSQSEHMVVEHLRRKVARGAQPLFDLELLEAQARADN